MRGLQLRRARAWMPCVDAPNAACPYDIHITVAEDQVAVASGRLLKQTWAPQRRKKFHFSLPQATVAAQVAMAVGKPLPCAALVLSFNHMPQRYLQKFGSL